MQKQFTGALALAGALFVSHQAAAQFADGVIAYDPGVGFVSGYTDASVVLGEPARVNPGVWGGPVDPFNPAWMPEQVVSLGAGGALTVRFDQPILNSSTHAHGIDFLIFGNAGFIDIAWPAGLTDGSLLGHNEGATRVSVSTDGALFYTLNPLLTPTVDGMFPTDGAGNFLQPVNPALTGASFNGQNLAGIRARYAGSGGGTGYDLAWALDGNGQGVSLAAVQFVRVEVLSGVSEIDAFAVVPEPATGALLLAGGVLGLAFRRAKRS